MARKPAWTLACLTQIAFTSGRFPIRTFVHLRVKAMASRVRARPFPNGWREGSILAQFVARDAASALRAVRDDRLRSIAASGDQDADAVLRLVHPRAELPEMKEMDAGADHFDAPAPS
jgi:hypothetical protein